MRSRIGATGLALVALLLVASCGTAPTPSPSPASTSLPSGAAPPAVAGAAPGSASLAPSADEEAIAYAISQRKTFGLRADEAWVRQVAADPRARIQLLDFLMLPEEEEAFEARQTDLEQLAQAVTEYGARHAGEFGGVWLDQARHTVVAAWTRNPEIHRIAILAGLRSAGPLEMRLVRYPERDLNALTDRLFADREWYRTIDATPMSGGAMIMDNRVELQISSANPQAPALIAAHFGSPPDMLKVMSDGTGIQLEERGTVNLAIVTADGKAPGRNGLDVTWSPARPDGRDCGNMTGVVVPEDGTLSIPCAPGGWTFEIQARAGEAWTPVGSGHVVVPSGGTVKLTITLDKGANLNP
jgi:hypothetical protein